MNEKKDNNNEHTKNLIKIILKYYNWEKELIFQIKNTQLQTEEKAFYLVDKNFMNKLKKFINYENIIEKVKNENNIDEEDIGKNVGDWDSDNSLYNLDEKIKR